ncbi:MAG TPA: type II toxin-antitoxin system RelE/ParE family toxin [Bacteroidia bacterium]|nr:type II toxin-antitoxin system RelE/ParE family toxin [Bacteroidota bacterium]HRA60370.1 type II toxin-antitoxin system RelE/ParE family toxin [Bacteroidia bacterium]
MNENYIRQTIVYGNYFWNFYNAQTKDVQGKIDWVIGLVRSLQIIPEKFFKHLEGTDGLYEMRIKVGSDNFRVFCCFDKGNLVILFNGFQKKSDKTPRQEIERAEKLKQQYYESKKEK